MSGMLFTYIKYTKKTPLKIYIAMFVEVDFYLKLQKTNISAWTKNHIKEDLGVENVCLRVSCVHLSKLMFYIVK